MCSHVAAGENKLSVLYNKRPPTFHYGVLVAYMNVVSVEVEWGKFDSKGENDMQPDVDLYLPHCTYTVGYT